MKESHLIQNPNNRSAVASVLQAVRGYCKRHAFDQAFVSMAYVSVSGVRSLLACFPKATPSVSKWVIGLDDCVSQPGAIDHVLSLPHSEVRIASLSEIDHRFHPKMIFLRTSQKPDVALMLLGSANLTHGGLTNNVEAVVFLEAESAADRTLLEDLWRQHWMVGKAPSKKTLAIYRKNYSAAKASRKKFSPGVKSTVKKKRPPKVRLVLETDEAEIDPSLANTCWIECGYITAMGRELEIKAEQGLFFGLKPTGGKTRRIRFRVSDGQTVTLKMKYQGNHMWRLQMTNEVPEVRIGLRPRRPDGTLGRSNKVAVITRTERPGIFDLRFVTLTSSEYARLKKQTTRNGTMGHTTARSYGWF